MWLWLIVDPEVGLQYTGKLEPLPRSINYATVTRGYASDSRRYMLGNFIATLRGEDYTIFNIPVDRKSNCLFFKYTVTDHAS